MTTALRILPRHGYDMTTKPKPQRRPEPRRSYGAAPLLQSLIRYAEEARDRAGQPFSFEAAAAQLALDLSEGRSRSMTDYQTLFGWSRQQLRDRREDLQIAGAELIKTPIENQSRTNREPIENQELRESAIKTPIENQTGTNREPIENQNEGSGKKESFPRTPFKERNTISPLTPQAGGTVGEGEGQEAQETPQEAPLPPESGKDTSAEPKAPQRQRKAAETPAELLAALTFPEHLRGEDVKAAFAAWIANRQGFRKPKRGWRDLFQDQVNSILSPLTPETALATLRSCTANGYQGLFARQQPATTQQGSSTAATVGVGGGNPFWYVMPYHAALADATKNRYDGLPPHWIQLTGPDGKPYFLKPEHASRPLPEGFVRKGGERV